MDQPAAGYLKRPLWYNNIDGVGELGMGFMLLAYGLLNWLQLHTPKDSVWNQMYGFLLYVGVMCAIIHYGTKAIKRRITYPRTGFVEYRKLDTVWRPMILGALVSGVLAIALSVAVRSQWDLKTLTPLGLGLFFALGYAHAIARRVRWKWSVVLAIAVGSLTIAMLPADRVEALVNGAPVTGRIPPALAGVFLLWFLFYGSVLLISGGISFYLYLRHTHPPALEAQ